MAKRIIICCDGTGADENKAQISNVLLTHRAIERYKSQPGDMPQISWYDPGVGTGGGMDTISGGLNGIGLTANIIQAYLQIVEQYESEEDEIYLFGFSRGAYTVRSLAGLIRNIGLLRPDRAGALWLGLEMYRDRKCGPESPMARSFRHKNSREITIKFMGVWDTVGSLGAAKLPFL